jgi:stage V sporulation protein B
MNRDVKDRSDAPVPPSENDDGAELASEEAAPADEPPVDRGATARQAGRGGLAIAGAKVFFILSGLIQQIALKHILGLQSYGTLGRVQGIASVVYNPVVSASVQGVSRAVAQSPDAERDAATRRVLGIHAAAILPIAVGFFAAAPALARALHAPHLTTPLRIVTGVLFLYGLYTPLVGVLNGRKLFSRQALVDVLFATLRTIGLLGGAWLMVGRGLGVEGSLTGFVGAAVIILVLTIPLAGVGRAGPGGPSVRQHLVFIAPLLAGQFALNLLFQSDLQLLGLFAAEAAEAAGRDPALADTLAGAYRNAQLFCFLPYQLLLSVTFVLFPLLASAWRDQDREAVARYVRTGVRLAVVLAGLMVSVTASLPGPLLRLVFGADSAALGAEAMGVLALGLGAFAIFGILATVLTSLKREVVSAVLTIAALALVGGLCTALVRGQPYGADMLLRTAASTSAGLLLATLLAAFFVYRTARAVVPPITVIRVALGLGACMLVARALPSPGKLLTLGYAALLGLIYLVVLVVSRELRRADLDLVTQVLRRKS